MLDSRLALDQHVLGYWGFDEANVSDPALDETAAARHLTVANAASVVPARLGNGRQFDGAGTIATLTQAGANAAFRQGLHLTIICWVTLDSVLQTGSKARTILCCDGDGGVNGRALYDLHVTNDGRVVYEHQNDDGAIVRWQTAPGTLRTGRYYSLTLVRDIAVFKMDDDDVGRVYPILTLRLNNVVVPWETITSAGVPLVDVTNAALPAFIDGNDDQTFKIGHSGRRPDAFWHGVVDELSVHVVARAAQPYLDAAYYRITLATSITKLTAHGDIRAVGGAEMGGGTRWWCYERDRALYVIRENSLGLFSKEILLTTGGQTPAGGPIQAGAERPVLAYEKSTDTLVVCFLSSGRVFKITATSSDAVATASMPMTADVGDPGSVNIKATDAHDLLRVGAGGSTLQADATDTRPAATNVAFFYEPSFGVTWDGTNEYGYALYQSFAGVDRLLGVRTAMMERHYAYTYFAPVAARQHGAAYFVVALRPDGTPSAHRTAPIYDYLGLVTPENNDENALFVNRPGDRFIDGIPLGAGGGDALVFDVVTTTALKAALLDMFDAGVGAGSFAAPLGQNTVEALKMALPADVLDLGAGASLRISIQSSTRPEVTL